MEQTTAPILPEPGAGAGRNALVTGANTGIGLALCRALGRLGFEVLLGARHPGRGRQAVEALADDGVVASLIELDITEAASRRRAAGAIDERFGRLDVLINNAGLKKEFFPDSARPSSASLEVLDETLRVNVVGTAGVIQSMLPLLRRSDAGRIVNLSSGLSSMTWALDPELPFRRAALLGYCSSKAAINMLTVLFANELAESPIKVNAADPGAVATPMNPRATRSADEALLPMLWLATIGPEGPSGGLFSAEGPVPW